MKFKGTKGEWSYSFTKKGHIKISDQGWHDFAKIYTITKGNSVRHDETLANALLISKAPELLEMLIKLCKLYRMNSLRVAALMDEAEELIKEATEIH